MLIYVSIISVMSILSINFLISYKYYYVERNKMGDKKIENTSNFIQNISKLRFIFERLRVFPRLFLSGYLVMLHLMLMWAIALPNITSPQSALISAIIGIATPLTKFYIDSNKLLYNDFQDFKYINNFFKYLDRFGYMLDRLRIFPLLFVTYYCASLSYIIYWAMNLGASLTPQQATFVSVYAGSASFVLGFFITTSKSNLENEKQFIIRSEENEGKTVQEIQNNGVLKSINEQIKTDDNSE